MARITLAGPLQAAAGGQSEFDMDAGNIRELLTRLGEDHPRLKPILDKGVTVAIDGEIYASAWFQPIPPDSEVYILPRMAGG